MHIPSSFGDAISAAVLFTSSTSGHKSPTTGWSSIIGIVTAIIGNVLISFALNTQRYAHVRLEKEYNEKKHGTELDKPSSKKPNGYGAMEQNAEAERRSKANHAASGLGTSTNGGSFQDETQHESSEPLRDSFHSGDTLKQGEKDDDDDDQKESYLKSPIWWVGIVLMTVGETGNFLAYGFAPASIVSPLGVVALVVNCLIAPLMLKERFRQRDFWGVLIAIGGAVTVVLSAKQNEVKLGPDELWNGYIKRWEFLAYILITTVAIIALAVASPRYGQRTIYIDIGMVGLFGGYTALSTKGVASLLSTSLWNAFTFPIFYVLILVLVGSAVMQIRYLNKALQNFDSTQVIPTQFVMFTLSVIIGSAVLYRDFESTTPERAIKFIAGCLLTFYGVYLITSKRQPNNDHDNEDYEEDEQIRLIDDEANQIDESTPLQSETRPRRLAPLRTQSDLPDQSHLITPPRSPALSSDVPSIAVTPASGEPLHNPWRLSSEDLETPSKQPPRTPTRDANSTPFFTPATSQPLLRRQPSAPADPETPTRHSQSSQRQIDSPPKADVNHRSMAETPTANTSSNALRLSRNSLSHLLPGPLLGPLSSSLSGIVADSRLRGEGSPSSVRARLRRNRSAKEARRRSIAGLNMGLGDEENTPGSTTANTSREGLTRPLTHPYQTAEAEGDEQGSSSAAGDKKKNKNRLRSLSETFGNFLPGGGGGEKKKGKRREDDGTGGGGGAGERSRD